MLENNLHITFDYVSTVFHSACFHNLLSHALLQVNMSEVYAWELWEQTWRMFGANFSKALFFHFSFSPFYIAVFM